VQARWQKLCTEHAAPDLRVEKSNTQPSGNGSTTMATVEQSSQQDRELRSATRFFWAWLIVATAMSVTGNVAHAVLTASAATVEMATAAALVPPAVLLAATHSVALLVRIRTTGLTYWTALLMTVALSAGAFVLSFEALRALAATLGWTASIAWLLPCVIDVAIAQATMCLLSLNPPRHEPIQPKIPARSAQPTPPASGLDAEPDRSPGAGTAADSALTLSALSLSSIDPPAGAGQPHQPATLERWLPIAELLVGDGVTTKDPATVAAVLAQRAAGTAPTTIGRRYGIHHTTVTRILEAAVDADERGASSA
jgi:hypothetical protein